MSRHVTRTGLHTVADLFCTSCDASLGWTYLKAQDRDQVYKEGESSLGLLLHFSLRSEIKLEMAGYPVIDDIIKDTDSDVNADDTMMLLRQVHLGSFQDDQGEQLGIGVVSRVSQVGHSVDGGVALPCSMYRNGLYVGRTYFYLYLYRLNVSTFRCTPYRHTILPNRTPTRILSPTTRPDVTSHNAYLGHFLGLFVFRSCLSPLPEVGEIAKGKSSWGGRRAFVDNSRKILSTVSTQSQ
jgi:hypothetical protein